MRRQIVPISTLLLAGLCGTGLLGCNTESGVSASASDQVQTGQLQLPLEAFADSGQRYQLINAQFEIRNIRTGTVIRRLSGDEAGFSPLLSTQLDAGEYTVTLLPGWLMLKTGGDIGNPPPLPIAEGPTPVLPIISPPIVAPPVAVGGAASMPPVPPPIAEPEPPFFFGPLSQAERAVVGSAGASGSVGPSPVGSGVVMPPPSVDPPRSEPALPGPPPPPPVRPIPIPGATEVVDAALASNAVQFVEIESNQESFAVFTFRVGDQVISFQPGRLNIFVEVIENDAGVGGGGAGGGGGGGDDCNLDTAQRPAVIEHKLTAVNDLSLEEVFDAMAQNAGFGTPGVSLYEEIIDSYATAAQGLRDDAVHCGDETTNGVPTLNGFPIDCNRAEHRQFDKLDRWFPLAMVNRIDLAPESGAHCGQQRLVFGNNAQGRMLMILEAQIPNPTPEAGIDGCLPLARFWAESVRIEDPLDRGRRLQEAFLSGSPELQEAGFGPFVTAANYTVGSGQIRTNNFDDGIWTLREFKTVEDQGQGRVSAIPFPVAEAPNGTLWNDNLSDAQAVLCQDAFVTAAEQGLVTNNPAAMSFVVPDECRDAESRNDGSQDYARHLLEGSGQMQDRLDGLGSAFGLSGLNIADRARFAGSCIGCHTEANGRDLGQGVSSPFSNGFTHIGEFASPCENDLCFQLSGAMTQVFLPHRLNVLQTLVPVPLPPACELPPPGNPDAGAAGGAAADGGAAAAGAAPLPPAPPAPPSNPDAGAGGTSSLPPPVASSGAQAPAAPPSSPQLAAASTPIVELVAQEGEIRQGFGTRTLGGQSAQTSH